MAAVFQVFRATWASGWKEWQASQVQASTSYLGFSYRGGTLDLSHFKGTKRSLLLAREWVYHELKHT